MPSHASRLIGPWHSHEKVLMSALYPARMVPLSASFLGRRCSQSGVAEQTPRANASRLLEGVECLRHGSEGPMDS